MTSLRHRALSVLCAATLATSMMPTQAFAETVEVGASEYGAATVGNVSQLSGELEPIMFSTETSSIGDETIVPFALDGSGHALLKEGSYEKWIDRIDDPGYVRSVYDLLCEATDGDGDRDYLIEDCYFNGTAKGDGVYAGKKLSVVTLTYTDDEDPAVLFNEASRYIMAATAAFDRDRPEVFWLTGNWLIGGSYGSNKLFLSIQYEGEDYGGLRNGLFEGAESIKNGMDLRDECVNEIQGLVAPSDSDEAKIRKFNEWLTSHNEYNTDLDSAGNGVYPDAWECISALEGRSGDRGPVCEAYSRAFKVLCDESGIPCVLVDGDAGGPHMWNYVQLDGAWYGVDVTWNDPSGGKPGAVSERETDMWLLVGASTKPEGQETFLQSHPVSNKVSKETPGFTNGPVLSEIAYEPHEHDYGAYVCNNDAKVGVDGTETATCSRCGAQDTRTKAGTALKAEASSPGASQPTAPSTPAIKPTSPSTPVAPTSPSTPTTKPSTSAGSSAAAGSALAPAKGQTVSSGGATYTVTGAAAVTYAGPSSKKAASVTVPATVAISGRTYKVTAIASKAFAGNKYLKSVKIGANVTAIPASAFKGCTKLTSVSFGNGITSIGKNAFYGCKALKSVTLGTKIATIGDGAFQNCAKLTKVTVKSTKLSKVGKSAFAGCKKLKSVTLKTTKLKSVGKNALKGTAKKLVVKAPKSKVRAYQKLFKNKGSKTVRVTK